MSTGSRWILAGAALLMLPLAVSAQKPAKPPKGGGTPPNPAIAYEAHRQNQYADLMVMDADGKNQLRLVSGGYNLRPAWSPDGEWIAFSRVAMTAPGVYMVRRNGSGLCQVVPTSDFANAAPAWSPATNADGKYTIVYGDRPDGQPEQDLFAVSAECNASDRRQLTDTPTEFDAWPAWSPDGLSLAACVAAVNPDCDIHVFDVVTDAVGGVSLVHRADLTSTGILAGNVYGPAWTADSTELVVSGQASQSYDLWVISATTPGVAVRLTDTAGHEGRPTFSPDQTRIAFAGSGNIYTAPIGQPWSLGQPTLLLDGRNNVGHPSWRPF